MAQHKHGREAVPLSAVSGTWSLYHQQICLCTHSSPLVSSCSCLSPAVVPPAFRVVRCLTQVMTLIPFSSLGYGMEVMTTAPFIHCCTEAKHLWFGATQYLHFNCDQLMHNCVPHKHYSTTVVHKKGLQPSTTFWEGQVFQVLVWLLFSCQEI